MTHTSPPTDADLLTRYMRAGDERAFAELVRAHQRLVIGTAARITGNEETGRDVAQQVFAALAQKAWLLTDRTSLTGWLHHAARHIALRQVRSETARHRRHERIAQDNPAAPDSDVWPMLEESLGALPDAEREAVVMHHLQDHSYTEMAAALGMTEAAVRKRVSRGLKNLGDHLRRRGYGKPAAALLAGAAAMQFATPSASAAATVTTAAAVPFSLTVSTLMANSVFKTAAVILIAAAIPLAWMWRDNAALRSQMDALQRDAAARPGVTARPAAGAQKAASVSAPREPAPAPAEAAPALAPEESAMVAFMQEAGQMSASAFGERMAELLTSTDSVATLMERAAMTATIDAERMAAVYTAYKKRKGAGSDENSQILRPLLVVAGQRDGLKAVQAMQAAAPDFIEISSLVHGWVLSDPSAATNWFNEQSGDTAEHALGGLIWGLGQRDTAIAKQVFQTLDPQDQQTSASNLASSLVGTHGVTAVDSLIEGLSPELAQKCVTGATYRIDRRPPAEAVPWLAGKVAAYPEISGQFESALKRWTVSDPAAAQRWLDQAQAHPP